MTKQRVLSVGEMPLSTARCVVVADCKVCLVHADDGRFYAVDDTCTHEGASLSEGWTDGFEIECPLHNAMFDLRTGAVTAQPAVDPVRTYPVTIEDDDVYVEVPEP